MAILIQTINKQGGLGNMWQLFGDETDAIINSKERRVA